MKQIIKYQIDHDDTLKASRFGELFSLLRGAWEIYVAEHALDDDRVKEIAGFRGRLASGEFTEDDIRQMHDWVVLLVDYCERKYSPYLRPGCDEFPSGFIDAIFAGLRLACMETVTIVDQFNMAKAALASGTNSLIRISPIVLAKCPAHVVRTIAA